MPVFNDLGDRQAKELANMKQVYDAWKHSSFLLKHSFAGRMHWETRSGREYLYVRKSSRIDKSLGPRSPETEAQFAAYEAARDAQTINHRGLTASLNMQAGILASLSVGRLDRVAGRVLRKLNEIATMNFRVIGTHALFLYENQAGVRFSPEYTATEDIDILVDDRSRLRIISADANQITLVGVIKHIDKSFAKRGPLDFRLTNKDGYMVEFLRPEPKPSHRKMPLSASLDAEDVQPAPIDGLQWLVNCPGVEGVVLDLNGFPVDMKCPDPRYLAAHKLWVSKALDRDGLKAGKDRKQAESLFELVARKMKYLPLDEGFLETLPMVLRADVEDIIARNVGGPSDGLTPNW